MAERHQKLRNTLKPGSLEKQLPYTVGLSIDRILHSMYHSRATYSRLQSFNLPKPSYTNSEAGTSSRVRFDEAALAVDSTTLVIVHSLTRFSL